MKCDVVVVGAGPGGSMAAKAAAMAGLDVIMLEKRQEIGDPVRCAEGVSKASLKEFLPSIDPRWIAADVKGAKLYAPDGTCLTMSEDKAGAEVGYVLERKVFDRSLAAEAAKSGTRIMVKTRATGLLFKDGKVCGVKTMRFGEALDIASHIVIGADGVESKVGRWAGIDTTLKPKDISTCAQFLVEDKSIDSNYCEFYFGNRIAPGGYIWVFPKGDNLANVGIGIVGSKSEPGLPTKLITNFVQERFPKGNAVEMVVGGVPVAGVMETTTADGVMLVGDAAHHTDALTGGGILNAMRAGVIAGKVAAKAIAAGDVTKAGLKEYEDRWRAAISMNLERSYEYKEFLLKLTDEDLNKLLGPLAAEDISKMDLRGMIRLMFKLNPKLLWELRQLVV